MDLFNLRAKIGLDTSEYEKGLDNASGKAHGFGNALKNSVTSAVKITAAALAAASAAVVAFAKSSVDAGMQFDKSMSQVAATMGKTVDEIQELRDFALEMGSTTAFSATEAADALNYMALAGYDAKTSMAMLPNVLNLAAAGGIELAQASDMITDASSALGLSVEETAKMVDKMAVASSNSNTSVGQLGEAYLAVGATAQMMAGGTTELSAALGILADNGTKGAEGGTRLRNILLSLGAPTDTAAAMMKELGISAYDADGNMRPLQDTLADLNNAMSDMTSAERTNVINTIFNKTDLGDVNYLLGVTSERWDELSNAIDDSQGAAEIMANTQLDNLAGDITLFKSALEGAKIAISDKLTPTLREMTKFGTDAISKLSEAFQEGGLEGAMEALGEIMSKGLAMLTERLPQIVNAGMKLLNALVSGIIQNLPAIGNAAVQLLQMLASLLIENLPGIAGAFITLVGTFGTFLIDSAPMLIDAALSLMQTLANGLIENLPTLIPAAVDMILSLVDKLTDPESISNIIDTAILLVMSLANGLIAALPQLIETAPKIIQNLVDAIVTNLPTLLLAAAKMIGKLAMGIVDNLPQIGKAAGEIIVTLGNGIVELAKSLWSIGGNIVSGVWNGIKEKKDWFFGQVKAFFNGIIDSVKQLLGIHSPSRVFAGIGQYMAEGLGEGWDDEFRDIRKDIDNDLNFNSNISASGNGAGGSVVVNVYGAEGQNVSTLADIVAQKIQTNVNRRLGYA